MAKKNTKESELVPLSMLDLFTVLRSQNSIESDFTCEHRPQATLAHNAPIEINFSTAPEEYLKLHKTELYMRMKIALEKPMKDKVVETDWNSVSTCNNLLNSIFKQVEFHINDRLIDPPYQTYPYKTYLEKQLGKSGDIKRTSAQLGFWFAVDTVDDELLTEPKALIKPLAGENVHESREFELLGKIHLPMFEQRDTALVGGCKIKVRLIPNDPAFYIKMASNIRLKSVEFTDFALRFKGFKTFPKIHETQDQVARAASNYRFNNIQSFVVPVTLNQGTQDVIIDNLHSGQVPNRAFVTFVDHRAFTGSSTLNPYNFKHYDVNCLALYVNGQPVGGPIKTPNFKKGWYSREYYDLFEVTNQDNVDTCITITRDDFAKGNSIFAFRILPDLGAATGAGIVNPIRHGTLRLHLRFDTPLPTTITTLVYLDFNSTVEINFDKVVVSDFNG